MFFALAPTIAPLTLRDLLAAMAARRNREPSIDLFKKEICDKFGVKHAFLSGSGRCAMVLAIRALSASFPDRDEVAIPAYTSFSVPAAIVKAGFKVRLYDVDPETLSPKIASVKQAIRARTLCVVACHLFGYPCNIIEVEEAARERGVPLIDDAAQAMGASFAGKFTGTFGSAGIFSFGRGKNITAVEGGAVITNSDALAALMSEKEKQFLQNRGKTTILQGLLLLSLVHPRLYWLPRAIPALRLGASLYNPHFSLATMSPYAAEIGRQCLRRLDLVNAQRKFNANRLVSKLCRSNSERIFPQELPGAQSVYLRLPILDPGLLPSPNLGIVRSYPLPVSDIPELKPYLVGNRRVSGAERLVRELLTLPTHHFVKERQIDQIVATIEGVMPFGSHYMTERQQ